MTTPILETILEMAVIKMSNFGKTKQLRHSTLNRLRISLELEKISCIIVSQIVLRTLQVTYL